MVSTSSPGTQRSATTSPVGVRMRVPAAKQATSMICVPPLPSGSTAKLSGSDVGRPIVATVVPDDVTASVPVAAL